VNREARRVSKPISYAELVRRTGIEFLPGAHLADRTQALRMVF
jgi:endonuclease G